MNKKNSTPQKNFLSADDHSFLLGSRVFAPLFLCQFFSAFNDNFIKNTLIFLIITCGALEYQSSLISLTNGIFSFPFLLFSAIGGQLADRFNKAKVARLLKLFTLFIALATVVSLLLSSITLLMICLFILSSASAFFGPIKYAALPDHIAKSHLPHANAWVETATLIAILLGTLWAGISFDFQNEMQIISALIIIIFAILSWATSCFMPENIPAQSDLIIDYNIIRSTKSVLKDCIQEKPLLVASLIISWFLFVAATFLTIIPMLSASLDYLPNGTILFLTLFAIFSSLGSAMSAWLSAKRINLLLTVIGMFVFAFVCIDLSIVINNLDPRLKAETLIDFFSHPKLLHIIVDFALAAVSSTFLVVPGFSALQAWAKPHRRARVIAANNILNAAVIVIGSCIITFIQYLGASIDRIVLIIGISSLINTIAIVKYFPRNPIVDFIFILFRTFFRLNVKGLENFSKAEKYPILAFNHVSFLNVSLALAICEITKLRNPVIVVNAHTAKLWWMRLFTKYINVFPIDLTKPLTNHYFTNTEMQKKPVVIFLEKNISVTKNIVADSEKSTMTIDKIKVVPIKIYGFKNSFFSGFSKTHKHRRLFPTITALIHEPVDFNTV
ncbi:MFS transporter [Bartonella pachyuromydis]|uniref:Phospholipid/glycerol acyltransferase domain-containing protein n=1 Tax=Bartonella pachyuromydis TaxID=931097 RepID=A0ABP8VBI9_9HYPH